MKRLIVAALSSLFGTGLLFAQGLPVRAEIPFDFHACNRVMPAGQYLLDTRDGALIIREQGAHSQSCVALVQAFVSSRSVHLAILTFSHYGDEYYLRRYWNGVAGTGQELPVSHAEKEQIARNKPKDATETTVVASTRK